MKISQGLRKVLRILSRICSSTLLHGGETFPLNQGVAVMCIFLEHHTIAVLNFSYKVLQFSSCKEKQTSL